MGLAGVPAVDLAALPAGGLFLAPVGGDVLAVQDQVRQSLLLCLLQRLAQARRLRGEHLDGLVQVPVGGGLRDPEAAAQPDDIGPVPEPAQDKDRLFPAGQRPRPAPGA